MQFNRDEIRVTIWNFQLAKPKYQDYFLKNEDFLHLTFKQLEELIQSKYLKSKQKIILLHGKVLNIDDRKVNEIFDKHLVSFNYQGQIKQISPYKLPLHVIFEEQIQNLSQEDRLYFQHEQEEITKKRKRYLKDQLDQQFKFEQMIKEKEQTCFVIDTTKSMDKNIDKILAVIRRLTLEINNGIYSFVFYKDFNQKIDNKYQGIGFTCSSREVLNYLLREQFKGGDDVPDDLQGGLEQALQYNWNKLNNNKPKTIVVITDAPCHGIKYHNQNIHDDFPNEDIKDTILKIVSQNISLKIYTFDNETDMMIEEINNIQRKLNIPNSFHHFRADEIFNENGQGNDELDTTQDTETDQTYRVNLHDSRILRQLSQKLTDQHQNIMNKQVSSNFKGNLISYYSKYGFQAERTLEAHLSLQEIIILKDAQKVELSVSLSPLIKEKDQIYLVQFHNIPEYENKVYFTKTEKLRVKEDQAKQIIQNHFVAKILLQHFKEGQSIKPEHPTPDVQYSDLILIKIKKNEFIICEEYKPYPYVEFNTSNHMDITVENQRDELNYFLQFFSYESGMVYEQNDLRVFNLIGFSNGKQSILTDPHLITDKSIIGKHENNLAGFRFPSYFSLIG